MRYKDDYSLGNAQSGPLLSLSQYQNGEGWSKFIPTRKLAARYSPSVRPLRSPEPLLDKDIRPIILTLFESAFGEGDVKFVGYRRGPIVDQVLPIDGQAGQLLNAR